MSILDPLINAGGSLFGSTIGGLFGSSAQDKANASNQQLMREQNEYNSAVNQRKRLEDAGMNPFLAQQQIATGNATSVTPPTINPVNPMQGLSSGISNGVNAYLSTTSQLAQARKTNAEADLISAQLPYSVSTMSQKLNNMFEEEKLMQANRASVELNNQLTKLFGRDERFANLQNVLQSSLTSKAQEHLLSSSQNLTDANVRKVASEIITESLKQANIRASTSQIKALLPYTIDNLRNQSLLYREQTTGKYLENSYAPANQTWDILNKKATNMSIRANTSFTKNQDYWHGKLVGSQLYKNYSPLSLFK